jgi:uncharacterized protein
LDTLSPNTVAAFWGLGIGAVIGAAAFVSNFCALGGVADILFAKDWRRMRAWMLAAGVALVGTHSLDSAGLIHIDRILAPYILWLPTLIGGTAFGFGMALSGGCINRALVRIGAGSLKSLVIVLIAVVTAAVTVLGPLKPLHDALARAGSLDIMVAPAALHRMFGVVPSWDAEIVRWVFVAVIGGGLIVFRARSGGRRTSDRHDDPRRVARHRKHNTSKRRQLRRALCLGLCPGDVARRARGLLYRRGADTQSRR